MKYLVTCANAGEAGLYQSILESEGIDVEIRDGRADVASIPAAQLFVAEEDHPRAAGLIEGLLKQAKAPTHPADGFPFLGIMGFTAISWCLLWTVLMVVSLDPADWNRLKTLKGVMEALVVASGSFLWGLFIGAIVALVCLIVRVTHQKLALGAARRDASPPL